MRAPIKWDLYADRGVPFSDTLPIIGQDFTGATFSAQVRYVPDAGGAPIITLTSTLTYGGSATVAAHIASGRVPTTIYDYVNPATGSKYASGDTIAVSLVKVAASDMVTSIPRPAAVGASWVGAWDMLITPSGGTEDKWIYGTFTVRGTVTQ